MGLACLDNARGIASIVKKLPFSLQDKWMTLGYTFRQQLGVPFSLFVNLVVEQARMRKYPSFTFSPQDEPSKTEHFKNTNRVSPERSTGREAQGAKMGIWFHCLNKPNIEVALHRLVACNYSSFLVITIVTRCNV